MEKDTIRNYLTRSEFSDVQAAALSDILAEQATRSDLRQLRGDFRRLELKVESRLDTFEQKMEGRMDAFQQVMEVRMNAFEQRMDDRMNAFEQKMDDRMNAFEQKMDDKFVSSEKSWNENLRAMEARLTWRLVALATFLGVVIALVGQFAN